MMFPTRLLLLAGLLLGLLGSSSACDIDGVTTTYGTFEGAEGVKITYITMDTGDQSKGGLLMVPGAKTNFLQYCDLAKDMKDLGFAIYMMDHRGQGQSDRLLDDPMKHHVDKFDNYVSDLKTFYDLVISPNHNQVYGWADSMGAGIITRHCQTWQNDFAAIVLSSPMHNINTSDAGFPEFVADWLTGLGVLFFAGESYACGQGPYDPAQDNFETNVNTSDRERYESDQALYQLYALGGPTNNWIQQVFGASDAMRHNADKLIVPTLILQAELDVVVENSAQNEVCDGSPSCTLVVMQGSKHTPWNEVDAIRNKFLYDHTIPFLLAN